MAFEASISQIFGVFSDLRRSWEQDNFRRPGGDAVALATRSE